MEGFMENSIDILLSLEEIDSVSSLKTTIYEEELKEINAMHPLDENKVDINQTYFVKNDNTLEVGFFIRNGLKQNLSIEEMPLTIQDSNGNTILTQSFNFKKFGVIPSHCGRPFSVNFVLPAGTIFDETMQYSIKFAEENNFKAFQSVATEIENMPTNYTFEQEKALRDFENSLPTLKAKEFSISVYNIGYSDDRGIICTLLLRNGNDKEAKLEKLPISIIDENGITIAQNIFSNAEGLVKVGPYKSDIISFKFKPSEVALGILDFSKCRVEYK
jgi:SLAP domain-containing protein